MNDFNINLNNFIVREFPDKVSQALEKAAQIVENDAKRKCPVDDGVLRASITHEVEANKAVIGTNVEYAPYVHEGTGIYAKDGNGRQEPWSYKDAKGEWHTTKGQKPNPFLQEAFDENADAIKECFKDLF